MKEYDMFVRFPSDFKAGVESILHIRDTSNYESQAVRAKIYKSKRDLPEGVNRLIVRTPLGVIREEEEWSIQIIEKFDDEALTNSACYHCAMIAGQGALGEVGE